MVAKRVCSRLKLMLNSVTGKTGTRQYVRRTQPDDYLVDLCDKGKVFQERLGGIKKANPIDGIDGCWYPHNILGNLQAIEATLTGTNRNLKYVAQGKPVADIGGTDGDLLFFLETAGFSNIHLIESADLNCSHLKGAFTLKKELGSSVVIHDIDIERQQLPSDLHFGLVFFLGTLYHLKDPFRMLEYLGSCSEYCLLSTRIARVLPDRKTRIDKFPVAYLLGADELNNDPSNYFVFSPPGLKRLCERAGWEIVDWNTFDNTVNATPDSLHQGERAFCLLRRRKKQ